MTRFLPKSYEDGIGEAVDIIDGLLHNEYIDGPVPTSVTLKLIKYALLNPEEQDD